MSFIFKSDMAHLVTQTQDDDAPSSSEEELPKNTNICHLESMEHSDLCAIDPGKNKFCNHHLGIFANHDTSKIVKHMLDSSQHVKKLQTHVSQHGCLLKHDAAIIIWDIVIHHIHCVGDHVRDHPKHTPRSNWAFGVLLYFLMCGPPPNNHSQAHIDFYNKIGLGVVVVHSKWFGSPGKRKKWTELDIKSKLFILKLVHTGSKDYADAFSPNDLQWSDFLLQKHGSTKTGLFEANSPVSTKPRQLKVSQPPSSSSSNFESPPSRGKAVFVTVQSHQRKMPLSSSKGGNDNVNNGGN